MTSAYPTPIDDLIPAAQDLMVRLGELPSRNRLMTELRIGAPKADRVLEILASKPATERQLHAVPDGAGDPVPEPGPAPATSAMVEIESEQAAVAGNPDTDSSAKTARRMRPWPVLLLALPAFVAIWSGWVGLGGLAGFGIVHPLPGIVDNFTINTAITLPIGVEAYAAYAMRAWLSGTAPARARTFAMWSVIGSLLLGMAGQVAYHLMTAAGMAQAPWQITTFVSCLPVAVLGCGAALAHLLSDESEEGTNG